MIPANVNWIGIAAAVATVPVFVGSFRTRNRPHGWKRWCFLAASLLASLPAILFTAHYLHVLPEWEWFYALRSLPGSEWLVLVPAVAASTVAGMLPRSTTPLWAAAVLVLALIPHVKPIIRPLDSAGFRETWQQGACLQSCGSTCGPASTATIMSYLGMPESEGNVARTCHTSASGTEAWYLARHIRSRGLSARFDFRPGLPDNLPLPAMTGVRLGTAGHFIAILSRDGDTLKVADPLSGMNTITLRELEARSPLTGFHLCISRE